jgi:phosphatidylglycerol:prolipoprotein diacylglycerol transferase
MITISIDPIFLSIGHFHLRWYGIIIAIAAAIGVLLAGREVKRKGFNLNQFYDSVIWILIAGLVGARLFHVFDYWKNVYSLNPLQAFYIWEGGLAIWGGVLGGLIAIGILSRIHHWQFPKFLDAIVPGVVLAQAIGRLACIITGDSVGKPTSGPFGLAYTNPNAMVAKLGVFYTPTPIYEIVMNLGIFTILWKLRKKGLPEGVLTLVYLILYSIGRLIIGFTSSYQIIAMGLTQSQIISVLALLVSLPLIIIVTRRSQLQASN